MSMWLTSDTAEGWSGATAKRLLEKINEKYFGNNINEYTQQQQQEEQQ